MNPIVVFNDYVEDIISAKASESQINEENLELYEQDLEDLLSTHPATLFPLQICIFFLSV